LASTKLTEAQSATRTITQLASLGFIKVVTSVDAVNAAQNALRRVYGRQSGGMVRKLRKLLQATFHIVPTPSPESVQECLPEVLDPADALILSAARNAGCFVLLTYNTRHFVKAKSIKVLTPKEFVEQVRKLLWFGFQP
ncbi:MAG: type II toxin-antitoxin system VapC family toxin, partial [Armatimonadota bacterium]